jgi:hypothetical protein
MFQLSVKRMLAVLLSVLMLRPFPLEAAPTAAVLGSISSYGVVTVGDQTAPMESTLFAGDQVKTGAGSAVIQYTEGTRVLLSDDSSAQFAASNVQLQSGQMTFRSGAERGTTFLASSLRLEPAAANSSANIILKDGKASVAVTEGTVRVVDPTGAKLATIQAGQAGVFTMASAATASAAATPPAPSAAAAAPQARGAAAGTVWLLALGVASAGTIVGITGLVRANNAQDRADELERQLNLLSPNRPR